MTTPALEIAIASLSLADPIVPSSAIRRPAPDVITAPDTISLLNVALPAALISKLSASILLPPSLPDILRSLSDIRLLMVISSELSEIENSLALVPTISVPSTSRSAPARTSLLNCALPASDISIVRAVIALPPSSPLIIKSLS